MPEQKSFPTIPVSHWINLRNQFKKTIPGSITSNYLASVLRMTESSAKANIIPSLRQIGLIDNDNKVNQELAKQFRDDNAYPKLCAELIVKLYPQELRDAFPDKDSNRDQIKSWVMNHTGSGDSAAYKIVSFYLTLLDADASAINKSTNANKNSSTKKEEKPKKERSNSNENINSQKRNEPETSSKDHLNNSKPDLNINIQIHISSDASPDQIKSIFENMAKYLYKN